MMLCLWTKTDASCIKKLCSWKIRNPLLDFHGRDRWHVELEPVLPVYVKSKDVDSHSAMYTTNEFVKMDRCFLSTEVEL